MKREIMRIRILLLGVALLSVSAFIPTVKYAQAAQNYSKPEIQNLNVGKNFPRVIFSWKNDM